jgi:photosystem II stability/assembly factor-like uncharacterized protein
MTDLDTRIREALHADPGALSADALLDDVRRGVRRRRVRRTTGLVVAAAVVAAAIGGTALQRHHSPTPTTPPPRAGLVVGTVALSVTPAGEAFTVSANHGCTAPCSTIWKQDSAGSRTRLVTLMAKDAQYFEGPVIGIAMSPDGRDGWAWGEHLYATHDGGRTWTTVSSGPGAHPPTGEFDLIAGPDTAWAITRTADGARLWRTPVDQDAWVPAHLPPGLDPTMTFLAAALPRSRVAILTGTMCTQGNYAVGDGSTWKHVTVPRFRVPPQFGGKTFPTFPCGPAGGARDVSNGADNSFALATVVVGTTPPTRSDPVGQVEQLWVHGNRAILVTPTGVSPVDLHLGADSRILAAAHAGDQAWIVTSGHRLFSSDDGGRHWVSRR